MGIEAYLIVRVLSMGTEVQSYQGQSPFPPWSQHRAGIDGRHANGSARAVDGQTAGDVARLESRIYDGEDLQSRSGDPPSMRQPPYGNEEQVPRLSSA